MTTPVSSHAWATVLGLGLILSGPSRLIAAPLDLVTDGKSQAAVYLHAEAGPLAAEAAADLTNVLKKMSGALLRVERAGAARDIAGDRPAILLGTLAEQAGLRMEKTSPAQDGFRYAVRGNWLLIVGESDRGVYHGVYAFLESLGCGWYVPGPMGEVIPRQATLTLPADLDHSEISDALHRSYWGDGDWARKNKGLVNVGNWRHAWRLLVPQSLFETQPELFAIYNGQRRNRQLCTSNPETIRIAAETILGWMDRADQGRFSVPPGRMVFEVGPNDGGGLCQCEACAKLHTPDQIEPTSGRPSYSDLILKFANDVAEITSKKHPDKYVGFYIYSDYSRPPVIIQKIHPNVFPMAAAIRRCRIHGFGNPICPSQVLFEQEIRQWAAMTDRLGFYPYNFNLADSLLPYTKIETYRTFGKLIRDLHIRLLAWDCESMGVYAAYAPHLYLSLRMMWNSQIDVDAEMNRFYKGLYGPAAGPMSNYWTRLDRAYTATPACTGSSYGMHRVWTDELLAASRRDIQEAERRARRDPRAASAVAMAGAGLTVAETFMQVRKATMDFRFADAAAAQQKLLDFVAEHADNDPRWFNKNYSINYYRSFIGRTVTAGAEVMQGDAAILVKLPDVWRFALDPAGDGDARGVWKPDFDDAGWRDLHTYSLTWADQGLTWQHGQAWYRTRFVMPASDAADIRLWFGGFDEQIDVYLNGVHLGERTGFMNAGEYEGIREHLRFGAENVLAVRVTNDALAEIGTGGIMMPAMLYRPATAKTPPPTAPAKGKEGAGYEM